MITHGDSLSLLSFLLVHGMMDFRSMNLRFCSVLTGFSSSCLQFEIMLLISHIKQLRGVLDLDLVFGEGLKSAKQIALGHDTLLC